MNDNSERWLAFAREDLRVAELVLEESIFNQVCFHSHQCVEKSLKALIADQGAAPPRTHSITDLLGSLSEQSLVGFSSELPGLDDYYIPTRYPDAIPGSLPEGLPGKSEAEEALGLARLAFEEANRKLRSGH